MFLGLGWEVWIALAAAVLAGLSAVSSERSRRLAQRSLQLQIESRQAELRLDVEYSHFSPTWVRHRQLGALADNTYLDPTLQSLVSIKLRISNPTVEVPNSIVSIDYEFPKNLEYKPSDMQCAAMIPLKIKDIEPPTGLFNDWSRLRNDWYDKLPVKLEPGESRVFYVNLFTTDGELDVDSRHEILITVRDVRSKEPYPISIVLDNFWRE